MEVIMDTTSKRRPAPGLPKTPIGIPKSGRVARLRLGHGDGFIRVRNAGDIYFHRADLHDGVTFNTLRIGDVVVFELIEDAVSGARGVRVSRRAGA
jgi:cold shock CspA family protein